jgi:hypothetical protein
MLPPAKVSAASTGIEMTLKQMMIDMRPPGGQSMR